MDRGARRIGDELRGEEVDRDVKVAVEARAICGEVIATHSDFRALGAQARKQVMVEQLETDVSGKDVLALDGGSGGVTIGERTLERAMRDVAVARSLVGEEEITRSSYGGPTAGAAATGGRYEGGAGPKARDAAP